MFASLQCVFHSKTLSGQINVKFDDQLLGTSVLGVKRTKSQDLQFSVFAILRTLNLAHHYQFGAKQQEDQKSDCELSSAYRAHIAAKMYNRDSNLTLKGFIVILVAAHDRNYINVEEMDWRRINKQSAASIEFVFVLVAIALRR